MLKMSREKQGVDEVYYKAGREWFWSGEILLTVGKDEGSGEVG